MHAILLPKNTVIKIQVILRSYSTEIGGLDEQSFEVESATEAINHLVSIYLSNIPVKLLLTMEIECIQLKIGLLSLFLSKESRL